MQRITRLPLLTAAIISHLPPDSQDLNPCKEALEVLNNLVRECNEATRHKERMEEMTQVSQTIDFRYRIHQNMQIKSSKLQRTEAHFSYFLITMAGQTREMHTNQLERKC